MSARCVLCLFFSKVSWKILIHIVLLTQCDKKNVQQLYLNARLYFIEGRCHVAALHRQICQTSQSNWSGPLIYVVWTQVTVQVPDLKQSFDLHTYKYCTHHIGTTKKRQTAFSGAVHTPFSYSVLCKAPKLGLPPLALKWMGGVFSQVPSGQKWGPAWTSCQLIAGPTYKDEWYICNTTYFRFLVIIDVFRLHETWFFFFLPKQKCCNTVYSSV